MKHKWAFIFHTLFIWGMYVLMFYITTSAIAELDNIPFGAVLIAFIAASFTIAAFTLFDVPEAPSLAFGWIIWSSQTIMIVIFGSLSFVFLPIYNRINKKSV